MVKPAVKERKVGPIWWYDFPGQYSFGCLACNYTSKTFALKPEREKDMTAHVKAQSHREAVSAKDMG